MYYIAGHLAIELGKYDNICLFIDGIEGLVRNVNDKKVMGTCIAVPSPEGGCTLSVMEYYVTDKYGTHFRSIFTEWYDFLTYINNNVKPRMKNWMSDRYCVYINYLCEFFNLKTIADYKREFLKKLKDNLAEIPDFKSYFHQCCVHVRRDFEHDIDNDETLTGYTKQLLKITMNICVTAIINVSSGNQMLDSMNQYIFLLSEKEWNLSGVNDCYKKQIYIDDEGNFVNKTVNMNNTFIFEHDEEFDNYVAEIKFIESSVWIFVYLEENKTIMKLTDVLVKHYKIYYFVSKE